MRHYAGIGSRETPQDILEAMTAVARKLSQQGFILRSGHAGGADLAFEQGADPSMKEIYIPWRGFNGSDSKLFHVSASAMQMASEIHPAWNRCSEGARKLHARNCAQILGQDLNDPVKFVVCWTKDGGPTGGTGQAIRLAASYGIPVFNLHSIDTLNRVRAY